MAGLIMKLIICPLTVFIADMLFATVNYANIGQIVFVGLVLAVLAHIMEILMFRKATFWLSTLGDFVAAVIIVYYSQFFLRGASITFSGAILAGILLGITEYFQHKYLVKQNKVKS